MLLDIKIGLHINVRVFVSGCIFVSKVHRTPLSSFDLYKYISTDLSKFLDKILTNSKR